MQVLGALVQAAKSATSLLAVGKGRLRGGPPQWLKESAGLVLAGLAPGSAVLQIGVPCLEEAVAERREAVAEPELQPPVPEPVVVGRKVGERPVPSCASAPPEACAPNVCVSDSEGPRSDAGSESQASEPETPRSRNSAASCASRPLSVPEVAV